MNIRPRLELSVLLIYLLVPRCTDAQGQLVFANIVSASNVNAPVSFLDGTRIPGESDYTAQLYGGPAGASLDRLIPLFPTTLFRPSASGAAGYIFPVAITIPDVEPFQSATLVMRVYKGLTWEDSQCRGESQPLSVEMPPGTAAPADLVGLQAFSVTCIPEPRTWALLAIGGAILFLRRTWPGFLGDGRGRNLPYVGHSSTTVPKD